MARNERPQINIRAESDVIELWHQAAKVHGLTLSAWLRMVGIKAARRDVRNGAASDSERSGTSNNPVNDNKRTEA